MPHRHRPAPGRITGGTDDTDFVESKLAADAVREHIAANASKNSKGWWLPAVWSEDKPLLRAAAVT